MVRCEGLAARLAAIFGLTLLTALGSAGSQQQPAAQAQNGPPVVELKPEEINLWDHRMGPDTAIHLTAAEYREAMTKSRFFAGQSFVEFEIVVSDNGRVDSAKLVGDAHGFEDQARIVEMARTFKPWLRDGVPVRVRVRDSVALLPPEIWADAHVPFPEEWDAKTTSVGLKRTVCFGNCPDYEVTVSGDGTVRYTGNRAVTIPGGHVAHISVDAARQLVLDFKKADFLSARGEYRGNWTDNPTQTLTLTVGGRTKTVVDYVGTDAGLPLAIRNLEAEVDEVAGTKRWVKGDEQTLPSLEEEEWPFSSATPQNVALYAEAISAKNGPLIEHYLAMHGPAVSADPGDASPMCVASGTGDVELVGRMMTPARTAAGAAQPKVAVPAVVKQQCLWSAARSGNVEMLRCWLDLGADPKVQPAATKQDYWSGVGIVANGVMSGHAEMVRKLLEYKMDLNSRVQEQPLLTFAIERGGKETPEIVELLVKAGADVNARGNFGQTPIFNASFTPAAVKALLAGGADIDARDSNGNTPLVWAAYNEGFVRELLADGADPTPVNKRGDSALKIARQDSCPACAAMIEDALKQRAAIGVAPGTSNRVH